MSFEQLPPWFEEVAYKSHQSLLRHHAFRRDAMSSQERSMFSDEDLDAMEEKIVLEWLDKHTQPEI